MYGSQLKLCTHCISASHCLRSSSCFITLFFVFSFSHQHQCSWLACRFLRRKYEDVCTQPKWSASMFVYFSPTIFYTLDFRVRACYSITIITALRLNGNLKQIIQIRCDFLPSCIFMLRCCMRFDSRVRDTIQQQEENGNDNSKLSFTWPKLA